MGSRVTLGVFRGYTYVHILSGSAHSYTYRIGWALAQVHRSILCSAIAHTQTQRRR